MAYCRECSASLPPGATSCPICGASLLATPTESMDHSERHALDAEALGRDLAAALAPRYELLRQLGAGGMGLVFLAREPALKRLVAVKLLSPDLASDAAARSRFEREARAAAALSHPNVVRVYAVGESASLKLPFIVMQYVEGSTLADEMVARGRMGEREARRIIGDVAAALSAAHAHDLVHRDIKPSNVLIEKETRRAYVADFGVSAALSPAARAEQTRLTATGMMIGTPVYMSPEQASAGDVGPASDVYSLGVLGYELLTGQLPFTATTPMGWAAAHLRDTPTPVAQRRSDVAPEVVLLVDRCLAKDPARRPAAADVARGMLPSLETEAPWPPPGLHALAGRARILTRLALVSALAGVAVLLLLAFPPEQLFARGLWLQWFATQGQTTGPFVQSDRVVIQRIDAALGAWQAALILASLVFAGMLSGLFAAVQRSVGAALRHRISGWRWTTLVDVAADTDGRSGLILAGAREFASLDAPTRGAVLKSRRVAVAADLFTATWIAFVLVLSVAAGFLAGPPSATVTALLEPWVVGLAVMPAAAALAVAVGARVIQRSLLGALARRPAFLADTSAVGAWYESAPGALQPGPMSRFASRAARAASGLGLTLVAAFLLVASAVAGGGAVVAFRNARWLGSETTALLQDADRYRAEDRARRAADLMRPYVPAPEPATDSEVRAWFRALTQRPVYVPGYAQWQRMMRAEFPVRGRGNGTLFRRAYEGRIGRDTTSALAAIATQPSIQVFRRLARAGALDLLTLTLDHPLSAYGTLDDVPWPRGMSNLDHAAEANAIAALGDAARRDLASAERRLGENYHVVVQLRQTPMYWPAIVSRNMQRWVFGPLAEIARLQGNQARADSLEAAGAPSGVDFLEGAPGLATDIADLSQLRALVTDERFTPNLRFQLVDLAFLGFCTNPREVVFGPSRERRATLVSLAKGLRNLPHVSELADLMAKKWNSFDPGSVRGLVNRGIYCGVYFRSF